MTYQQKMEPTVLQPEVQTTRLNANIKVELHTALKIKAATEGTTIGALIEEWISSLNQK
jgi:predicted HicB family RNase H-like nuclease